MEIFQYGAFPYLEYHFFQVIWCFSAYFQEILEDVSNNAKTKINMFVSTKGLVCHSNAT